LGGTIPKKKKKKVLTHFQLLADSICSSLDEYATKLAELRSEFEERFSDFRNQQPSLDLLSMPFSVNAADMPGSVLMELLELQTTLL